MKIEKLRKNHKKEIIIGTILTIVIGGVLTFRLTHSKYRVTQSIDLGSGVINYKVPDFKIMAVKISDDGETYSDTNTVPDSGYILNTTNSVCNVDNVKDNNITIEYADGKINFLNVSQKGTKCYLYFNKKTSIDNVNDLVAKVQSEAKTITPDFSLAATTNDGVYSTMDGMYGNTTYYWRGKVENNYVKFAGFCWRIIRINGDKTIRMIYDGSSCHANGTSTTDSLVQSTSETTGYAYNSYFNQSNYVGWTYDGTSQRTLSGTDSNAKRQIEIWYDNNIGNNEMYNSLVADGKYCNDRDAEAGGTSSWSAAGSTFNYAGYKRLLNNKTPTFNCGNSGDVYTLKVGLIIADEVVFAGGKDWKMDGSSNNTSYYLYNGQHYWTMTPSWWYNWDGGNVSMFAMDSSGSISSGSLCATYGLRPVINLKSDVTFSSGNGTQNSPYVV